MTRSSHSSRLLALGTILTGTLVLAGCGHDERVTRSTTTEQTTTPLSPVSSSITTTTTRETQP